ncbi:MAG TPA: SDR family oxidoreductase [Humisphaera sp.]
MRKTVLITGTSSGLGKTAAGHFAANDWNVVATMRTPPAEPDAPPADNVLVARLDVQDRDSIAAAIGAGVERFGRIDALVNNAGFGLLGLFEATPPAKVREQFDVNLFGLMDVTRAVLPHFRARGGGTVVNVGSGAGVFGLPMMSLYCASKFALEGFSEALSYELASQNVAVKLVEPGGVVSNPVRPPQRCRGRGQRVAPGIRGVRGGNRGGLCRPARLAHGD